MSKDVISTGRILYVEPNDVYEDVDGVALSPDYSDYCIYFNLIVDVVSRFKGTSASSVDKKYTISWVTNPKGDDSVPKHNQVSFLQGQEAENFNFLTTYYTDINYEDIASKHIVEGLGVESVQVSFQSYYVPTVVIKFVDVRGSSLFGREEASHGTNNILKEDTIFGCFFTLPYPRFRLQIKGFHGQPVTYQLTCSDFKSEFNAQTGNFEATATFIGYSYSLLTDIPFQYILAAPLSPYEGAAYWDKMVETPEWALANDKKMVRLVYMMREINQALLNQSEDSVMNNDDNTQTRVENEINLLNEILTALNNVVSAFNGMGDGVAIDNKTADNTPTHEQILVLRKCDVNKSKDIERQQVSVAPDVGGTEIPYVEPEAITADVNVSRDLAIAYDTFISKIRDYNTIYSNPFSNSVLPNGISGNLGIEQKITFTKFCTITENSIVLDSDWKEKFKFETKESTNAIITKIEDYVKFDKMVELREFGYLVDYSTLRHDINTRLTVLKDNYKIVTKRVDRKYQESKKVLLSFEPYIGNIVKIIIAHLDTFIHMITACANTIADQASRGERAASKLGIDMKDTDVPVGLTDTVPPFPLVRNNGAKEETIGSIDENIQSIGWLGDISDKFEEIKLITGLQAGAQHLVEIQPRQATAEENKYVFPILPFDSLCNNIFEKIESNFTLSDLAGFIGFRASQILGIFSKDINLNDAKLFGRFDAYNLYRHISAKFKYEELLKVENGLARTMNQISVCEPSFDKYGVLYQKTNKQRHNFETVQMIAEPKNGRHPLFINKGGRLDYVHYYDGEGYGLVPSRLWRFNVYQTNKFKYIPPQNGEPASFVPRAEIVGDNVVFPEITHKCRSNKLDFGGYNINGYTGEQEYINDDMFNVITNPSTVKTYEETYNQLASGDVKLYKFSEKIDTSNIVSRYYSAMTDEDYYKQYFTTTSPTLWIKHSNDDDKDKSKAERFVSSVWDFIKNIRNTEQALPKEVSYTFNSAKEGAKYDGKWVVNGNEVSVNELVFQNNLIYDSKDTCSSLFGHPFYFLQNNISDVKTRNHVKALIFLHTLGYDFKNNVQPIFNPDTENGMVSAIPYGLMLLMGGLLWRKKWMDSGKDEPIKFSDGVLKYKPLGSPASTLFYNENGDIKRCGIRSINDTSVLYMDYTKVFGAKDSYTITYLDDCIVNKLIKEFESFAEGQWLTIMKYLELRPVDIDGTESKALLTAQDLIKYATNLESVINNKTNTKTNDDDPKSLKDLFEFGKLGDVYTAMSVITKTATQVPHLTTTSLSTIQMLINPRHGVQSILKDIYLRKCIIYNTNAYTHTYDNNGRISFSNAAYEAYLSGFEAALKDITQEKDVPVKNIEAPENEVLQRDLLLPMYLVVKNVWDKWLISRVSDEQYTVKEFFKNFIFIDAYYRNIFKLFVINCEKLLRIIQDTSGEGSVFSVLGAIASEHNCQIISMPDYICLGDDDDSKAQQTLANVFKTFPYGTVSDPEPDNKFIFMYTPTFADSISDSSDYSVDSYDLVVKDDNGNVNITNLASTLFNNNSNNPDSNQITRYGYHVPSFGVAYSRQNNHLFKSIRLNMNNPVMTDQSIKVMSMIADLGSGNNQKIVFYGQDTYPIFNTYAYNCEIEMMGNAQIMPLMYFQLMNIPMWRGAYMIYEVSHHMTPGNMVTRFKGMKMSSTSIPYNSEFMTNVSLHAGRELTSDRDIIKAPPAYIPALTIIDNDYVQVSTENADDYWHMDLNQKNRVGLSDADATHGPVSSLINLFNRLCTEIRIYQDKHPNQFKSKWNVMLSCVGRAENPSSDHYGGYAMDLKVVRFDKDWATPKICKSNTQQQELLFAFDVLLKLHNNEIRQVLLEYRDYAMAKDSNYNFNVLHVAVKNPNKETDKNDFSIMDARNGGYKLINKDTGWSVDDFLTNAPAEFLQSAKSFYDSLSGGDKDTKFRSFMRNFGAPAFANADLKTCIDRIGPDGKYRPNA